jgi:drug/metabolite transporter (DMT)-like permease
MTRFILILLVGLVLEAVGVVLLSKGLHEIGEVKRWTLEEVGRLILRGAGNGSILLGVALEAGFFVILLYLLSQMDVSLVWPLTALGFVLTPLAAKFFRHEEISAVRWSGVALIVAGAALVAWSEHAKSRTAKPTDSTAAVIAPLSPGQE